MIYLDNAATTRQYHECLAAIEEYAEKKYFNPSALYKPSVEVSCDVKETKEKILNLLKASGGRLIFTASGTEADNLALFGSLKKRGGKIIVSATEHAAVINSCKELENRGYHVDYAPTLSNGSLDLESFSELLTGDTALVSVMHVNNETGAVNDLAKIVSVIRSKAPSAVFHSDGVQAVGKIPVNVRLLGVDAYSVSSHKIHGPKGIGALFVSDKLNLKPVIFGGGQEYGLRSATENTPYIAAFGLALSKTLEEMPDASKRISSYMEKLKVGLLEAVPEAYCISEGNCVPNTLAIAFPNVRGEVLMHALERREIYVGIGSACSSKHRRDGNPYSIPDLCREGMLRFSASKFNSEEEIPLVIKGVCEELSLLREFSRK